MPVVSDAVSRPRSDAAPLPCPDPSGILPPGVRVRASRVGDSLEGLCEAERALVARAVPKRRHEFATGRRLARELLAELGTTDFALLADADRAPLWPAGIIGSISHAHGLCVVAAAKRGELAGLGVDVEDARGLRPELWSRVLRPEEERWLRAQPGARQLALAAVFFSAKEAVYKAQFPLTRARLGFQDVALELDVARSLLRARTPGFARPLEGAYALRSAWVLSGVALGAGCVPA
ncbi:MAG: 4'-phosphopantetheinyl transferase superfamily protein [Myxococcota bacterium]